MCLQSEKWKGPQTIQATQSFASPSVVSPEQENVTVCSEERSETGFSFSQWRAGVHEV